MVVLSNSKVELDEEFNDWYSNVHIVELVDRLDVFEAAQRFVLTGVHRDIEAPYRYLALYWIRDGMLEAAKEAMRWQGVERLEAQAAGREPVINRLDVFEGQPQAYFFSSLCDRYEAGDRGASPR